MSTTLKMPKPLTIQQRVKVATQQLRELVDADDVKLLNAAIAEAAAAEAVRNMGFRATVRRLYEDLSALPAPVKKAQRSQEQPLSKLVPLPGSEGARFDPFAPLNAYTLLRLYGPHQLREALQGYSLDALREAASQVRQNFPKTKPMDARKIDSLIDYIVEHLTATK